MSSSTGSEVAARDEAQDAPNDNGAAKDLPDAPPDNRLRDLPSQFLHDQAGLWTSPRKARLADATWLVPLGGLTAALLATDSATSRDLNNDPNTLTRYRHISDYGVGAMAGVGGAAFFLGLATHNDHERETGFLSGEAAVDGLVMVEALKYAARRERPYVDNARGKFWHGGDSFPSEHAEAAWAIGSVIAHEYPNPFVRFLSYGLATTVSATRVMAKQHFPSDALVGSAIGWLVGEYVYRQHHDPALQGRDWAVPAVRPDRPGHWPAKNMGSPYMPLDSWVYPAFDRLIAMGYIHTGFEDMRPWTRMECARLMMEAQDRINEDDPAENEATHLYHTLEKEFGWEADLLGGGNNANFQIESAYTRATEISGKPLTDGYHFGQTVFNDYGRPYEQGFNNVSGASAWAEAGPFVGYFRAEYQHAPSAGPLPLTARQAMATEDFQEDASFGINPSSLTPPATAIAGVDQAHLLDTYVAMTFSDWQFSYGKQSLWWGPGAGGPMMYSDNADPINMFRVNRVTPFRLPGFMGVLGPMRLEFFIGQYSGYEFMFTPQGLVGTWGQSLRPQPTIHGERLSFKPSDNLEIGISRTTDYGGPGYPLTWHNFGRTLFSTGNTLPGAANKPGARRAGLDFSYKLPGLRNGATLYADGLAQHDEISPILGPDVAAWSAGLYIPRLPGVPKLDFRAEGTYTSPPNNFGDVAFGAFYWDATWITGFQNSGHLMGNWVGREGQGAQAWSTYWFTPRNKLQFSYRHQKVSYQFVPDGGTITDGSVRADFWARSIFSVSAAVQYEVWNFPVIAPGHQTDVSTTVQLAIWPKPRETNRRGSE
ncbi:MAG TPA: capsule assembly Wzi family protein [Candidatus Binatia bacterium]|nr:capsule assembly Wzi family protein [Candidatus Binatia bacterium]